MPAARMAAAASLGARLPRRDRLLRLRFFMRGFFSGGGGAWGRGREPRREAAAPRQASPVAVLHAWVSYGGVASRLRHPPMMEPSLRMIVPVPALALVVALLADSA